MPSDAAIDEQLPEQNDLTLLIHGFGLHRSLMWPLARRLERLGHTTRIWDYCSLIGALEQHARRLRTYLDDLAHDVRPIHLVAHSMGSLIVRLALADGPQPALGRVVLLAPPSAGSPVARMFGPLLHPFCPIIDQMSDSPDSSVHKIAALAGVEFGIIAARFDPLVPHANTELAGRADFLTLAASHTSLLFQASVAHQIDAFLSTGHFAHEPSAARNYSS